MYLLEGQQNPPCATPGPVTRAPDTCQGSVEELCSLQELRGTPDSGTRVNHDSSATCKMGAEHVPGEC
jgi:hypothetical protein